MAAALEERGPGAEAVGWGHAPGAWAGPLMMRGRGPTTTTEGPRAGYWTGAWGRRGAAGAEAAAADGRAWGGRGGRGRWAAAGGPRPGRGMGPGRGRGSKGLGGAGCPPLKGSTGVQPRGEKRSLGSVPASASGWVGLPGALPMWGLCRSACPAGPSLCVRVGPRDGNGVGCAPPPSPEPPPAPPPPPPPGALCQPPPPR